jgi:hypothetical protein
MSASSKAIAKTAAQKGTILSKSVDEEKRYKKSSEAQKALQKPVPLGLPSINPQERAAERKAARLLKKKPADRGPTAAPTTASIAPQFADKMPINPGMDEANKTAAGVFNTQGTDAFIKHVFTDQDTGRTMSYSEMRYRYG